MTYEDKKRWLWRYREALSDQREWEERIEQLQAEAERITPLLSPAPGGAGGNHDKIPAAVERIMECQDRLRQQISDALDVREQVSAAIAKVPDKRNREILVRRYILCQKWEEIAVIMPLDYSRVQRRHKAAVIAMEIPEEMT